MKKKVAQSAIDYEIVYTNQPQEERKTRTKKSDLIDVILIIS